MTAVLLPLAAVMAGVALLLVGNGLFSTFIALRMTIETFPTSLIGLVVGGYSLGFLLGCLFCTPLIRRVGHIRSFAAFAGLSCALALIYAFAIEPFTWLGLRVLNGLCAAGMFMVAESWLNHRTPSAARGRVLAVYTIVNKIAFGGGQFLLAVADPAGLKFFMLAALFYSLSLIPVAMTGAAAPPIEEARRTGLRELYRSSPLGVVGVVLAGLVSSSIGGMAPVFAANIGLGAVEVGHFMAVMVLGGLALQWPIGWLSDRFDRRLVLFATAVAMTVASAALAFVWQWSTLALYVLIALHGGLSGAIYPICVAHTNDFIERHRVVSVSGSLLLLWSTGAAVAPGLASQIMTLMGPSGLFHFVTLLGLGLAGFTFYRRRQRAGRPATEQSPFVPEAATTPVAAVLDPRAQAPDEHVEGRPD
jgi:MFS family permease